jgi:hypothetical protein
MMPVREIASHEAQPSTQLADALRGLAPGSGAPHALRLTRRICRWGITYASYSKKDDRDTTDSRRR